MNPIRFLVPAFIGLALSGCGWMEWPAGGHGGPARPPAKAAPAAAAPSTVTVGPGETIYAVAQRAGVPVRDLIEANRLQPPYKLDTGQRLTLPATREVAVARGDTLYGISRAQGVDMYALAQANGLTAPYRIVVGQKLKLPGRSDNRPIETAALTQTSGGGGAVVSRSPYAAPSGEPATPPDPPVSSTPAPSVVASAPADTGPPPPTPQDAGSSPSALPDPPPRGSGKFQWPVKGKLVMGFGTKDGGLHNDGVNIAAPRGTPVHAADTGVVAYAGNELRGFGNLLLIKHAGGWVTAYGHNETLLVKKGDKVERGQVIGTVGATGNVDAPQLHFEVRRGKKAEDPLPYMG